MPPVTTPESIRLAVDIGGTFTDVVLETGEARFSAKVLTTKAAPEDGVLEGMLRALKLAAIEPGQVGLIVHGTTLATNAIIERKGARTALVTTQGFRDSIEMAQENRFEQYDIFIEKPEPLVPRTLRFTVPERMDAKGGVRLPLDEKAVEALADTLKAKGIEAVAVGFLHSYANDAHEKRAGEILARRLPHVRLSLSSEVCPEVREYERFSTTCANAYVQPLMADYLERLRSRMEQAGFRCPVLLMTSGGGLTTLETAIRFPIRLVESGPAGGVILSTWIAERFGIDRILSFDMGGTTAKICIIDDGKPMASRSFEVDRRYRFMKGSGLPVRIPVIEMVEIGAGGGSLAGVDAMKRITVGPESAGSEPGPACYKLGGTRPAVTDANVVLGRIDPDRFAGGTIALDAGLSRAAIDSHVGQPLELDTTLAAFGISEVVEENMANAARVHAVERGAELEGRTLIAFGGGAPLHAARLAEKLGISDVLIPASAGVGSAVGFLRAPIAFEVVRSRFVRLSAFDAGEVNAMFAAMEKEATDVVKLGSGDAPITITRSADMRYAGQGHEILVPLPDGPFTSESVAELKRRFEAGYRALFSRVVPALDVEVVGWILRAEAPAPGRAADQATAGPQASGAEVGSSAAPRADEVRDLFNPLLREFASVPVHRRSKLRPGDSIAGPAVIAEDETTTIVTAGFTAALDPSGAIRLTAKAAPKSATLQEAAQ
ncbi:N-methylhydantoinase A [Enhydrobacter aerosaccus]|uniref:N-methylhydantoinase A n=1 Tax=Enhydrobacter aerosaccus TaxID=225324 RepID=A0A1T4QD14_9HYPH|nr:hydantoinase/oxoprolinase family protein [Enhydrobacter aerosaccus]SKA01710.1 N-methylhydantoinase A [Enhydrobacter aerosaccus]